MADNAPAVDISKMDVNKDCAVCFESMAAKNSICFWDCPHLMHIECMGDWVCLNGRTCPVCRCTKQNPALPVPDLSDRNELLNTINNVKDIIANPLIAERHNLSMFVDQLKIWEARLAAMDARAEQKKKEKAAQGKNAALMAVLESVLISAMDGLGITADDDDDDVD